MKDKLLFIFIALLLLIMVTHTLYTIIHTPYLRKQLLQKGRYSIATVTAIEYSRKSNATWPLYTFRVNGKQYTSSGNGIIQKNTGFYFDQWAINRKFYLIYLPTDPSQNSILPYCTVSPAYSQENKSWPSLPEGKINYQVGKGDE